MSNNSYSVDDLPEVPFDYGMVLKDGLFEQLYTPQIKYWNGRLRKLSERNVDGYARADSYFNAGDYAFVAIFYDGVTYSLIPEDEDEDPTSPFCLELYQGDKELLAEMPVVAAEITKLQKERYVAQRFLAGLAMFDPPPSALRETLGDGLSGICNNVLSSQWTTEEMQWSLQTPQAYATFVEEHQDIIVAMQERLLLNMITI